MSAPMNNNPQIDTSLTPPASVTQNPQQPTPAPQKLQEGQLDTQQQDPSLTTPSIAPEDALGDELIAARDPETAIYGPPGGHTPPLEAHIYAMDTGLGGSNPLDAVGETVKSVGAGVASLENSLGDLVDWGFTQANNRIAQLFTGKDGKQDDALGKFLFHQEERQLPDWLNPTDDYENLISGLTQFGAGWTGLGEIAGIAKIGEIVQGAGTAAEHLPYVAKLMSFSKDLSQEFPSIASVAQEAAQGLSLSGKTALVDFSAFRGQTGNLANAIQDATKEQPGLVHDVAHALAVHKEDDEGFSRLKNTIVGRVGEAGGTALFSAVKILKVMHGIQEELGRAGGKVTQELRAGFQQLHTNTEEFRTELAKIKGQDDPEVLKDLFTGQPSVTDELNASEVPPDRIHIIHPGDTVEEAAEKSVKAYKTTDSKGRRMERKMQGINQLLKEQSEQAGRSFNREEFVHSLQAKISAGQFVDIQQELTRAIGGEDLTNVDHFLKTWKEVVEATTTTVKRYVSNQGQKNRLKSVLAVGLGKDLTYDATLDSAFTKMIQGGKQSLTAVEDAALDRLGLNLLHEHVLAPQLGKLHLAAFEADVAGDSKAVAGLEAEISRVLPMYTQAKTLDEAILSEFGRGLQTAQIEQSSEEAKAFIDAVQKAKRDLPLLKDSDLATPTGRKILSATAKDLGNNTDWSSMNGYQRFGKQFSMAMNAFVKGSHAGLGFSVSVFNQLFYNNILNSLETARNIFFHNHIIKGFDLAGDTLGGAVHAAGTRMDTGKADLEPLLRARDELTGYVRYFTDGIQAGWATLHTSDGVHPFDYASAHPKALSSEGIRSHFGKSVGDALADIGHAEAGSMADWVIDKTARIGGMALWPGVHMIGGIDTAFKISNQTQLIRTELASYARTMKGMADRDALDFAESNTKEIVDDLIISRSHNFSQRSPITNKHFNVEQLSELNGKLINNTNTVMMKQGLRESQMSDRWLFKIGAAADSITKHIPIGGPALAPFVKTFTNAMQYGMDSFPGTQFLSPYNWAVINGEMGLQAKNNLIGRQILGTALAAGGISASRSGVLASPQGSYAAQREQKDLTGENMYTLRLHPPNLPNNNPLSGPSKLIFPNGGKYALTLNFERLGPVPTLFFLPGRLDQLSTEAYNGTIDKSAFTVAALGAATQAFGSGQLLRGVSTMTDAFSNTSYSTGDNFYRNFINLTGSVFIPGGRINDSFTRYTDPSYRDFKTDSGNIVEDYKSYMLSRMPYLSNQASPVYDMFGNKRPRDDYIGDTQTTASNLVKAVTPIGIKYTADDPLSKELARFGKLGQSLIPASKNQSFKGNNIPLDQFKNDKGETLWDAYNRELRSIAIPSDDGSGKLTNLRDYVNALITSQEYQQDMSDNQVSRATGRRQVILGSRWGEINKAYQLAKEEITNAKTGILWHKPEYLTQYKNSSGQTLENVFNNADNDKETLLMGK